MVEKNTYLTTTKTTSETSYSVGDTVTYTATVNIPADTKITPTTGATDADYVIVHDTMDSKLAFAKDVAATVDSAAFADFTASYDETNGWTPSDDCTFELKIPVTNALLGKTITFTYTAEVTSAATDPDSGLVNTLFGEKNGYKTTPDTVEVWTFDFDLVKVFDDASDNTLTATFELRTDADDESTAIALISKTGGYIKADSDDEDAETEAKETVTQFTATNGEALNFQGFKAGKYYLVEIETSTGYNLLDGPVEITITDTTTTKEGVRTISHTVSPANALDQVEVQNHSGTVLPSTGGIGTTIFYVVGSILVVAAGVLLITKKRMSREG
jgi:fimbrial isopeptide formation D2 family protein/LPXTG-motif cell wall-anchored protein